MSLLDLANKFAEKAEIKLSPVVAEELIAGLSLIISNKYQYLRDAVGDIEAVFGKKELQVIGLDIFGDKGKGRFSFISRKGEGPFTNAKLTVAWKQQDDNYKVLAYIVDNTGKRIFDHKELEDKQVKTKPVGPFTMNPDRFKKDKDD